MVSNRSRYMSESTSDDDQADMEYTPNNQQRKSGRKPTRIPKCFSKNALMARENRLRKKVYISTLENQVSSVKDENKKLSAIVENQSFMIRELKKEVKYLKSVISNSGDIGKLIRAINSCTGMPVTSSLNKLPATNIAMGCKSPVASQTVPDQGNWRQTVLENNINIENISKHPWEEKDKVYFNYPTPESTKSYYNSPEFEELNSESLLLDLDIPLEMNSDELLGIISEKVLESTVHPVEDHNYHSTIKQEQEIANDEEDVGVCLHVSKNKVSLEFCSSCSENALQSQRLS